MEAVSDNWPPQAISTNTHIIDKSNEGRDEPGPPAHLKGPCGWGNTWQRVYGPF